VAGKTTEGGVGATEIETLMVCVPGPKSQPRANQSPGFDGLTNFADPASIFPDQTATGPAKPGRSRLAEGSSEVREPPEASVRAGQVVQPNGFGSP